MSRLSHFRSFVHTRTIRFQLTALLDLLLIIVFAQFLEVRQREQVVLLAHEKQIDELEDKFALEAENLREMVSAASRDAAQKQVQLERSLQVVTRLFQLDDGAATNQQLLERIRDKAETLTKADTDDVIRFLVSYDELLKRAEVWTIHASSSGEITVKSGKLSQTFRLESSTQLLRSQEFATGLFTAYKQFPQPKNLVVMLVSYDRQTTARVYQSLIDGLPVGIERIQSDLPAARVEYTVLGPLPLPNTTAQPSGV